MNTSFLEKQSPTGNHIDFKNDHVKANKWGKEYFDDIFDNLSDNEKTRLDFVKEYTGSSSKYINQYLIKTEGQLILPEEAILYGVPKYILDKFPIDILNKKIQGIDLAINHFRLRDTVLVYRWVSEINFGYKLGQLRDDGNKINFDLFLKLKSRLDGKTIVYHNYISTSLIQHYPGSDYNAGNHPILFKIIAPKETHAIYTRNLSRHDESEIELLIRRNILLKINGMKITTNYGDEIIEINLEIVNKE